MKFYALTLVYFLSITSAYSECVEWEREDRCIRYSNYVEQDALNETLGNLRNELDQKIMQSEKRMKSALIEKISITRKEIVADMLNDPEIREVIKQKIKEIELK